MLTKKFSIKRHKDGEAYDLEYPHPQTNEEMGSLCDDPTNGPLTLAIRQWKVDCQAETRRVWSEQLEAGAFTEGSEEERAFLQEFVAAWRYGGRGRSAAPRPVDLGGLDVSPELLERLRAAGVVAAGVTAGGGDEE